MKRTDEVEGMGVISNDSSSERHVEERSFQDDVNERIVNVPAQRKFVEKRNSFRPSQ